MTSIEQRVNRSIKTIAEGEARRIGVQVAARTTIKVSTALSATDPNTMGVTETWFRDNPLYTVVIYPVVIQEFSILKGSDFTAEVLDTIRHEVAHVAHLETVALTYGTATALVGRNCYHGLEWKKWARALGARPVAYQRFDRP